jgi:hypothetical protein
MTAKAGGLHILCCRGIAVVHHGCAPGALTLGPSDIFNAQENTMSGMGEDSQ